MLKVFLSLSFITLGALFGANFVACPYAFAAEGAESLQIDRIDFRGVTIFTGPTLETHLEISPGEKLVRRKVLKTEENLLLLYRQHGYEEVSIQSRLVRKKNENETFETVLEFQIQEGRPVRVNQLVVVPVSGLDPAALQGFQEKSQTLRQGFSLNLGDIFDYEKINEGKRSVQEVLASEEYVGGRVTNVIVTKADPPAKGQIPIFSEEKTLRWVNVEVQVDLGEKVSFGFRGSTAFTRGYLSSLVSEQRALGLAKDYVSAIQMRIEEEYRAIGYARVEITPYTFDDPIHHERKVTYSIVEGPRVKIKSVEFDGNSIFHSDELLDLFFSKASALVQHWFYVEKDVQKSAELLVEFMKEEGYLSAKLVTVNAVYNPKKRSEPDNLSVNLVIYLYEGEQTVVRKIEVEGAKVFDAPAIARFLRVEEGSPLNLYTLSEGLESIKRAYRELGYLEARITNEGTPELVMYSQENRVADIHISIDEGPLFRLSHIDIEGLEKTRSKVVRREFRFKQGEVLEQSQIDLTERALRRLGVFANVTIRVTDDPGKPGFKAVRVVLKEADRGALSYGPGYRYDLGIRGFAQLSYANLWGQNHSMSVSLAANRRFYLYNFGEGQIQLAYSWPWFLLPGMTFRPVFTAGRTQFINFSADTLTGSAIWDKQIFSNPNVTAYFGYTFERVNQFAAVKPDDNRQMTIGSISPKLTLDLRDNPLSPRSGFFGMLWMDLSYPFLGSQAQPFPIAYYRVQFRGDYYLTLFKKVTWYLSFRTGYEQSEAHTRNPNDPNADPNQDAIPLIKQFAMGGIGSLRGFLEQEINYQLQFVRGSMAYVNYRTQVELPFAGSLRLAAFLDAANLTLDNYSLLNLRLGTGFGFHYETPVGPVSLDWGFKIGPRPGEDPYVVHFSVGVI